MVEDTKNRSLEEALRAHRACIEAIVDLDKDLQPQILESVASFLGIIVEPSLRGALSMVGETIGYGMDLYSQNKASQHPAGQQVSDGQGREHIVSLIAKMMQRFPEEKRQEIHDYLVGLFQECYQQSPYGPASSAPSSPEASEEPAPQE